MNNEYVITHNFFYTGLLKKTTFFNPHLFNLSSLVPRARDFVSVQLQDKKAAIALKDLLF